MPDILDIAERHGGRVHAFEWGAWIFAFKSAADRDAYTLDALAAGHDVGWHLIQREDSTDYHEDAYAGAPYHSSSMELAP